jgi:hypothetical protein
MRGEIQKSLDFQCFYSFHSHTFTFTHSLPKKKKKKKKKNVPLIIVPFLCAKPNYSNHHSPTMFLSAHKTPPFLHTLHRFANSRNLRRNNMFCRAVPGLSVSSSISSVFASENAIAAAAGSGPTLHGAVTSAITHVAVTAVAIASGACLSTKVDFLWPKREEQPGASCLL